MSLLFRKQTVSADDKHRFVELVGLHGGMINKVCYYFAADADDFNDLRQDVLVNLWEGRRNFRHESKMSTWVYRVALNTCISSFQKRKRRGISVPVDTLLHVESDEVSTLEQHRALHSMIQTLSHREKAVLLPWLDGADYDTISDITGITRNTVATLLRRAKEKLNRIANS